MSAFSAQQDYVIEYTIDGGHTWQHGKTVPGGAVADTDMRSCQRAAVRDQAREDHGNVEIISTRILAEDDPRAVLNQPVPASERKITDDRALDLIAEMLRDPEWGAGMLEDIAEIVNLAGHTTENYSDDRATWDRH